MNATQQLVHIERFSPEQKQLILDTCCSGASEAEAKVLIGIAEVRGMNPLLQECYFVQRYDSEKGRMVWAVQAAIDSFRIKAEATGLYAGQDEPEFEYDKDGQPIVARVRVYRTDWPRPCVGVARYSEYVQKKKDGSPTRFWAVMRHNQLAKCAEVQALRKAFPKQLSKVYIAEEGAAVEATAEEEAIVDTSGAREGFRVSLLNASNSAELDAAMAAIKDAIGNKHLSMEDAVELRKVAAERKQALTPEPPKPNGGGPTNGGGAPPPKAPAPVENIADARARQAEGAAKGSTRSRRQIADDPPFGNPPAKTSGDSAAAPPPAPAEPVTSRAADGPTEPRPPQVAPPPAAAAPPKRDWEAEGKALWDRISACTTPEQAYDLAPEVDSWAAAGAPVTLVRPTKTHLQEKREKLEAQTIDASCGIGAPK